MSAERKMFSARDEMANIRKALQRLEREADRLDHIAATIRVNAIHALGATAEEAEAYVRGEKNFINDMTDHLTGCKERDQ